MGGFPLRGGAQNTTLADVTVLVTAVTEAGEFNGNPAFIPVPLNVIPGPNVIVMVYYFLILYIYGDPTHVLGNCRTPGHTIRTAPPPPATPNEVR